MELKLYLESRNIEHKEFATMIGVSPTSISNYIRGKRMPRADIVQRIIKATNGKVKLEDLLGDLWPGKDHSTKPG